MKRKLSVIIISILVFQFFFIYPVLSVNVPRSFFVNTTNGQPQSLIVVGRNAASMDFISGNLIITKIQSEAYFERFVFVTITGSRIMEASNDQLIALDPSTINLTWSDNAGNTGTFTYGQSILVTNLRFITTDTNNLKIYIAQSQNPINILNPELNRNVTITPDFSIELLDNNGNLPGLYNPGGNVRFNTIFRKEQPGSFQQVKVNIWEPQKLITTDQALTENVARNNNLILVGGPVANRLVAGLVQRGQSRVDWYTSPGDIEYIPNGLYGRDVIIVAGADREKTRAAVLKLISS
ncbi:MAG: S-layer protein precursor [Candidatus Methanofastidiosum methylothiophilum]|uniref:S-layer protein n=1 Tax=Candidatus Methanofastidiosum methylothiophilum TaxID=1705564 RepID=A0A150J1N1_9EURY|nr:MAG: S-layer protein precursor [Candidatus Methanofastidiosum methylthiophilus]KYC48666.1 MAG: S-layer protein precursor [Candidatus Methanofastidiosum methylthiophilus]KYC51129.1 MAG: S-layer protein precursor [Candidatus Methanofastidiosum methylthiophilus]